MPPSLPHDILNHLDLSGLNRVTAITGHGHTFGIKRSGNVDWLGLARCWDWRLVGGMIGSYISLLKDELEQSYPAGGGEEH